MRTSRPPALLALLPPRGGAHDEVAIEAVDRRLEGTRIRPSARSPTAEVKAAVVLGDLERLGARCERAEGHLVFAASDQPPPGSTAAPRDSGAEAAFEASGVRRRPSRPHVREHRVELLAVVVPAAEEHALDRRRVAHVLERVLAQEDQEAVRRSAIGAQPVFAGLGSGRIDCRVDGGRPARGFRRLWKISISRCSEKPATTFGFARSVPQTRATPASCRSGGERLSHRERGFSGASPSRDSGPCPRTLLASTGGRLQRVLRELGLGGRRDPFHHDQRRADDDAARADVFEHLRELGLVRLRVVL